MHTSADCDYSYSLGFQLTAINMHVCDFTSNHSWSKYWEDKITTTKVSFSTIIIWQCQLSKRNLASEHYQDAYKLCSWQEINVSVKHAMQRLEGAWRFRLHCHPLVDIGGYTSRASVLGWVSNYCKLRALTEFSLKKLKELSDGLLLHLPERKYTEINVSSIPSLDLKWRLHENG